MSEDDANFEESGSPPARKFLHALDWIYEWVLNGIPGVDARIEDLARSYGQKYVADEAIERFINWQIAKAGTAGFLTGFGGIVTLPVTIPANIAGVSYLQLQMIAAIAYLRGYDVRDDQVRTLAYVCLAGSRAFDVLKDVGVQVGTKLTRRMILRISGATLRRMNQAVGFRLVTKAGSRGVVNLVKVVPVIGGVVGGSLDAAATKVIGATAKRVFIPLPKI